MAASGDFESMMPMFEYYVAQLPLAELRTQRWHGHAGAFFPETSYMWGSYMPANYGCNRSLYPCHPRAGTSPGRVCHCD